MVWGGGGYDSSILAFVLKNIGAAPLNYTIIGTYLVDIPKVMSPKFGALFAKVVGSSLRHIS